MHTEHPAVAVGEVRFELRYRGLFDPGRGFAFPCDEMGHVELDRLSDRVRINYLYARATVGFELTAPIVLPVQ